MKLCPHCRTPIDLSGAPPEECPHCGAALPDSWQSSDNRGMATVDFRQGDETIEIPQPPIKGDTSVINQTVDLTNHSVKDVPAQQPDEPPRGSDRDTAHDLSGNADRTIELPTDLSTQITPPSDVPHESNAFDVPSDVPSADSIPPLEKGSTAVGSVHATWNEAAQQARPNMTIKTQVGRSPSLKASLVIQDRVIRETQTSDHDLADYDLISQLGEGGMGVVFTARQASIDRTVALKMLKPDSGGSEESKQKFLAEAVVTGELDHPNIVPIYDLGRKADGTLFYSMKKIQGTPWMDVIRSKPLPENLDILMKVADAVAFAHSRGVIHRDLKPENIMLGDFGEVLVLDWGLAMTTADCQKSETLPANLTLGGTPAYMAPEMVMGPLEKIGKHSDIYLLGAMLYECVTGTPPHTGRSTMMCLMAAGKNEIVPTDKTGELVEIARQAMATDPADRYDSVQAFQAAIRLYQSHSESVALSTRADQELAAATESDTYDAYARALYVFEEAFALWNANQQAREGVSRARLAYATSARNKGDFELGISILKNDDPTHQTLLSQLQKDQHERQVRQDRLKRAKRAVVALAFVAFAAVTIGMVSFLIQKNVADQQRELAIAERIEADRQRQDAQTQKKEADRQRNIAFNQREIAQANRRDAIEQRDVAQQKTREAEYEAYLAWIGLAAAKIEENALGQARTILSQCTPAMRDWEWSRLVYQCRQGLSRIPFGQRIESLAISDDGRRFAVGCRDGNILICQRESGRILTSHKLQDSYASALAFAPGDNDQVMIGSTSSEVPLQAWSLADNTTKPWTGHTDRVTYLQFSRDGSRLVTASFDQTARIWDVSHAHVDLTLRGHSWWVWSAEFSPDEQQVVTASQDGTVRLWDAITGEPVQQEGEPMPFRAHGSPVYAATFSPDGQWVASGGYDNRILIWQPAALKPFDFRRMLSGEAVDEIPYVVCQGHTAAISSLEFSPDGSELLSSSHDNSLKLWTTSLVKVARAKRPSGQLVKTLRGHNSLVRVARFAPSENQLIVSASHDGDVRLWDASNYAETRVVPGILLRGHADAVLSAAFSNDGAQIATASRDRTARTWTTAEGQAIREFREGHAYLASRIVAIQGGDFLATSAMDGTVRLWNTATGTQQLVLQGVGYHAALAVSPDNQHLATGSDAVVDDGLEFPCGAKLWDVKTGELLREFAGHKGQVTTVEFSPDGRWLFSGDTLGRGCLWDVSTGRQVASIQKHTDRINAAKFLPDDQGLLTASDDNVVFWWKLVTADHGAIPNRVDLRQHGVFSHGASVTALDVTRDGQMFVTVANDGMARAFRLDNQQEAWRWQGPNEASLKAIDIAPDDDLAIIVDAHEHCVYRLNVRHGELSPGDHESANSQPAAFLELTPHDALAWSAIIMPNGVQIATVGGDEARLWDLQGTEVMSFRPHQSVAQASYSHDQSRLVTAAWDRSARIWDVTTGTALLKLANHVAGPEGGHTAAVNSAAFSPDDKWVATASEDGTLKLWDSQTGHVEHTYHGHTAGVLGVRFSPQGDRLLSVSRDGSARVWRIDEVTAERTLSGHQGPVLSGAFSPDGTRVITGGEDRRTLIWDLETETILGALAEQTDGVTSVAFSPSGSRILTGGRDHMVKLWDAVTMREILTLSGHTREVTSVSFSQDGRLALSSSLDGTAVIWPALDGADPVEQLDVLTLVPAATAQLRPSPTEPSR